MSARPRTDFKPAFRLRGSSFTRSIAPWLALFLACAIPSWAAEYPRMGPDIFDPRAPADTLIDAALVRAKREHKTVLLLFGANWCPWCRRLHKVLESQPSVTTRLKKRFELVFLDANTRNDKQRNAAVIARYDDPLQHGLPVFVVLDRDGKRLTTQETASLAADTDAAVAEKVAAFLDRWSK